MHLFTLLFATAFASQFTAVDSNSPPPFELVAEPILYKNKEAAFTFKAKPVSPATWATDDQVFWIASPTATVADPPNAPIKGTQATHSLDEFEVTLSDAQMEAITTDGDFDDFTFYIFAGLTSYADVVTAGAVTVTLVADFTPDRKAIRVAKVVTTPTACSIVLTEAGDTPAWVTSAPVYITVSSAAIGTPKVDYTKTPATAGVVTIDISVANWATLTYAGAGTLYVFTSKTSAAATLDTPAYEIPIIADEFAITPVAVPQDAVKIKSLVISPVADIKAATTKVLFTLSKTEIFDLTDAGIQWQEAAQVSTGNTYSKANVTIDSLDLAKDEIVYVYGKYDVTTPSAATIFFAHSQEIKAGDNLFTVSPTSIARGALTIPAVNVTTTATTWGAKIKVKFSKSATSTAAADVFAEPEVSETASGSKLYTTSTITLPDNATWLADPKIFVHVGVNITTEYVFDDPSVEIVVNPEWSITSDAIVQAATAITTLSVDPVATLTHEGDAKITLHFAVDAAADRTKIPAEHTAVVTRGAQAADPYVLATWTIPATLKLMKGMPLYVHASYDKGTPAASNAVTWLEPALTLAVGGTDILEYEVEPRSVAVGATTLAGFKIVPKKPEYWKADNIAFKITDDTASSNGEVTGTAAKHATLNEWAPTAAPALWALDVAKPLKVHVSMTAATTYLPVVDTITVSPPPAAFTVEPDKVDVKKSAEFTSIKLTEKATTKTWDKVWVVVSKTAGLQAVDPTKDVEKTDQTATAGVVTIALDATDIGKLGKLDAPTTLYVYAAKASTAAALAATPATIAFENVISFTIAPKEMVWAENLTTPEITITPNDATLFPQAASTDFIAKFTKGTGTTAVSVEKAVTVTGDKAPFVYKIPATDLATLTIAKPTASETLKVSLHQTAGEIGTAVDFKINKPGGGGEAAMGVSPLLSLLAAALLLLIKLF